MSLIVPGSPEMEAAQSHSDRLAAAASGNVITPADENDPAVKLLRQDAERTAPPSRAPVVDADAVRQIGAALPPVDASIADALNSEAARMGTKA